MHASVVIITYNEEKRLPKLLASLQEQTFKDFETIVVDSKSTDGTAQVAADYENVAFHRMRTRGIAKGRNTGAELAKGEYIVFLDADVRLPKNFLSESLAEMQERHIDVASVRMRADTNNLLDRFFYSILNMWFFLMQYVYPHGVGSCMIAKKSVHRAIGGFDEGITLAEDNDYLCRARKKFTVRLLSRHVLVSARRFERENRFALALKYVLVLLHRLTIGEIRTDVFRYRFGHYGNN